MGYTLARKLIRSHLVSGDMTPGSEVALKIPVDLLLFVLSFQVERNWVFGQKDKQGIQQSSRR